MSITKEAEIEAFVRRFLKSVGATFVIRENGGIKANLPADVARLLDCNRRLELDLRRSDEGVDTSTRTNTSEFVTFGHPLLEGMLALAKERGKAANLLFTFSMEPDFVERVMRLDPFNGAPTAEAKGASLAGPLAELLRKAQSVRVADGHVRVLGRRITHQRQLLFFFKVSMLSDDKWESTLPLLIDPVTEEVDRPVDLTGSVSFVPHRHLQGQRPSQQERYTVERLYRKACDHLEGRLANVMRHFELRAAERARNERNRIEEYYRGLAAESLEPLRNLFRRISNVGTRAEMARSWQMQNRYQEQVDALKEEARSLESVYQAERDALQREQAQRLLEVEERFRPRAEITLTHAAYVMVPRIEWRLRIERDHVTRETTILYDLLRRVWVDWVCEGCDRRILRDPAHLCSCEAIVCEECHSSCSTCGRTTCGVCCDERCHLCGKTTCETCDSACPWGEKGFGVELPIVCQSCRAEWCESCMGLGLVY